MFNSIDIEMARERRRDDLANAEHDRLIAACRSSVGLAQRAARPLGRALHHLGARLLRYAEARSSAATLPSYRPSSRAH